MSRDSNGNLKIVTLTESTVVLILVIGYLGLTAYSMWKWNEAVSMALIVGFTGMATQLIKGYFDQKKLDSGTAVLGAGNVVVDKPTSLEGTVLVTKK